MLPPDQTFELLWLPASLSLLENPTLVRGEDLNGLEEVWGSSLVLSQKWLFSYFTVRIPAHLVKLPTVTLSKSTTITLQNAMFFFVPTKWYRTSRIKSGFIHIKWRGKLPFAC